MVKANPMGLLLPSLTFVILTLNVELAAVETNEDQVREARLQSAYLSSM